ncbi:MAG: SEC-C metal-binding domain-containing protein [Acidimicrobiia bacterium]
MSLPPGILAKVDGQLRVALRDQDEGLTARVPVSREQWAVWKRYCDMVGVSAGGGLAVLVDHELASVVDEEIATLSESIRTREAALTRRETELANREDSVARRERACDWREQQLELKGLRLEEREQRLDSREKALDLLATASQSRTPHRARVKPGRNELCWCDSKKKYKNCHLKWDQSRNG